MKKLTALLLAVLMTATFAFAQKASEGNEKSPTGGSGNAIVIELEGQAKNVEDVLKDKFKKLKGKGEKGFEAFKGQIFEEISNETLDIYYRVEDKGNNKAKVIMFLSKGYDNWLTSSENGSEINNAKKMLDKLIAEVRKYELQLAIDAQTKVVEGAIKDHEGLVKDGEDLVKEMEKLQKELEQNRTDQDSNKKAQADQTKKVEEQKKLLEDLKGQLGKVN
jgi:hypothetical protein